ncbi:MAG: 23S rRNA (uracil(1939)-C(5))-methyltransferase RlmD, partial [Terriglobales bacterium]
MLLSIEKLIYGGDGLARTPAGADGRSMAVFVPFVLPGERVEAEIRQEKPGFARGSVARLIEASPDRFEARCPYFRQCGGCHYQHIPYERQLEFKAVILRETLQRIAKIELKSEIRLHASPPWNYRNRTRLRVQTAPEFPPQTGKTGRSGGPGFALGYFRIGSHEFLPVGECPISSPLLNRVIARLVELRGLNCPAAVEEIELFTDAADERLLAWAFCGREAERRDLLRWAEKLERELPEISGVTFFSSRRRFEEEAPIDPKSLAQSGAKAIRYRTRNHEYQVSAGAFFQVNRYLVDELVSVVTGNARGEVALDLYAGVGLFSAALARSFHHIFGVEASQTSHADFVQNVPANVKAVGARTEDYLRSNHLRSDYLRRDYLRSRPVQQSPDLVVLDPPRTGAGKAVIRSLVDLGAPRVRYVSCDPATLARDLAPLLAAGYHIEEAHLFDLFPETFHI